MRPLSVEVIMGVMSRAVVTLAVVASGLLLSACGAGGGSVLHSGGSIVLVDADHHGEAIAGVGYGGDVTMVGDCLGIQTATVLWPHGTRIVSDTPLTIDVPGLGRVRVGDHVEGGGVEYVGHLPKGIDSIPSGCPTQQVLGFDPGR
jgi:hypothetical protein